MVKVQKHMSLSYVILRASCSTSRCNFRTRKTSLISSIYAAKVGRISSAVLVLFTFPWFAKGWGILHFYNYEACSRLAFGVMQWLTAAFGALRTAEA